MLEGSTQRNSGKKGESRIGWAMEPGFPTAAQHPSADGKAIEFSGWVVSFQREASSGFTPTQEGTWMPHLQREVPGKNGARYRQ